jgi:hypothetical protein
LKIYSPIVALTIRAVLDLRFTQATCGSFTHYYFNYPSSPWPEVYLICGTPEFCIFERKNEKKKQAQLQAKKALIGRKSKIVLQERSSVPPHRLTSHQGLDGNFMSNQD